MRTLMTGIGVSLLAVGVGLVAVSVTGLLDEDSRPRAAHVETVDLSGSSIDLALPSPTPNTASPSPTPLPPLGDKPYTLVIEKIDVNAPVYTYGLDEKNVPEVPYNATDIAWYNFSAKPGTGSNAVFAGHVTWNGVAVFYNLDDIAKGDSITLTNDAGVKVIYKVSDVFQVDPSDPDSLKVMYGTGKDVITLITCSGTFTYTGDPDFGGEYDRRLVVRGDLVSVTLPAAAVP